MSISCVFIKDSLITKTADGSLNYRLRCLHVLALIYLKIGGYDQVGNIEDGYTYIWRTEDKPLLAGNSVTFQV